MCRTLITCVERLFFIVEVNMRLPWFVRIPRILVVLVGMFMVLFSFDVFESTEPLGRQLLGFLMHNLPVLLLFLVLFATWKRPLLAGIIFIILAISFGLFIAVRIPRYFWIDMLAFGLPLLGCGVLFVIADRKRGKTG